MKKGFVVLTVLLMINLTAFSQEDKGAYLFGPSISYQNQSGNFLKFSAYGLFELAGNLVKVDLGGNYATMRDHSHVIPELGLTYFLNDDLGLFFVKGELTPYTITPKVGVSFVTFLDIALGYGFDMGAKQGLKPITGLTFSVSLNIPVFAAGN